MHQFSLRTLLVLVGIAAVFIALYRVDTWYLLSFALAAMSVDFLRAATREPRAGYRQGFRLVSLGFGLAAAFVFFALQLPAIE
jgi:hypothetical protein